MQPEAFKLKLARTCLRSRGGKEWLWLRAGCNGGEQARGLRAVKSVLGRSVRWRVDSHAARGGEGSSCAVHCRHSDASGCAAASKGCVHSFGVPTWAG